MSKKQADYETRAATFIRVAKNPDNPFVMIDRRPIENPKVSWKAKGLLAYLLSRPDNWVIRFRDLVQRSPDGAHTVRAAMKELKDAGHVKVVAERENGRVKQWTYTIVELPDVEFQQVEKQQVENRTFNNKNKDLNEKKVKKAKPAATPKAPTPPEILIFREVTKLYPPKVNWDSVVNIISSVSKRLGRPATADDLRPFFAEWTFRGFKPTNINWTSWAVTGEIPQQYGKQKQVNTTPKPVELPADKLEELRKKALSMFFPDQQEVTA